MDSNLSKLIEIQETNYNIIVIGKLRLVAVHRNN